MTKEQVRGAQSAWDSFKAQEMIFESALDEIRAILDDPRTSDYDLTHRVEALSIPLLSHLDLGDQLKSVKIKPLK